MRRKNFSMALSKTQKSTLKTMATNLGVAAKILKRIVERMPEDQPELICELATRVEWAMGFRSWAGKLREDQPLQLQRLRAGASLDQQILDRKGSKKRKAKPPKDAEPKKTKSR